MPARSPRNISLNQLAEHTGLSVATVSSVINGRARERRISPASVERVREAARELGYVPNIFAQRLSRHTPGTAQAMLAIITSYEAPLNLVSHAALALHRAVRDLDRRHLRFTITIEMFDAGALRELPGLLEPHRFSGAIIANTVEADDAFLQSAVIPFPVVLVNRSLPQFAAVSVSPESGGLAARELLGAGCRRCAVLTPAVGTSSTATRVAAFGAALAAAGSAAARRIASRGLTEQDGHRAMRAHLRRHPDTDGLFATSDSLAIGAYRAIRESGREIPRHIRVVGIGDHPASPYLDPPLTCVGASEARLHTEAAGLLLGLFTGQVVDRPHRVIPPQVVRRGSTGR